MHSSNYEEQHTNNKDHIKKLNSTTSKFQKVPEDVQQVVIYQPSSVVRTLFGDQ